MGDTGNGAAAPKSAPKRARTRARTSDAGHVVVTGYPGFLSKRLVRHLRERLPRAKITLLVGERMRAVAEADAHALGGGAKIRIAGADVQKMDLGLAGLELDSIADATHVFHLAGIQRADAPREVYERVNVDGVRNVLALCRELPQLKRLVHFSSCLVSGDREGVITEDELDCGQGFRSAYEESKFRGERLVRAAAKDIPVTIVRPSLVVGSSRTGEIDRFDGVYTMGILVVTSPVAVPIPLPGPGTAPLNLVPVDFVTSASVQLALDPRAEGRTFHIVDPNPLSVRHVYELIAQRAGRKVPKSALVDSLAARVLKLPGIGRFSQRKLPAIALLEHFVVYNCSNTLSLLDGTGITCPRFDTYVDKLMAFVTESLKKERSKRTEAQADPFE
jgi:nucleoside-diphosphate-sugar epimerase